MSAVVGTVGTTARVGATYPAYGAGIAAPVSYGAGFGTYGGYGAGVAAPVSYGAGFGSTLGGYGTTLGAPIGGCAGSVLRRRGIRRRRCGLV